MCCVNMSSSSETDSERIPDKSVQSKQPNDKNKVKPNRVFRELPLKRALKSYVISTIIESYSTLGIRVLWKEKDYSDMYSRREELEQLFKTVPEIKIIISCVTAMEKGEELDTGFSFWLVFDWPDITVNKFEHMLCKKVLESGFKIATCKGVRGRGMKNSFQFLTQSMQKKLIFETGVRAFSDLEIFENLVTNFD